VRVALLGGGTAGHLFPSVAVAQTLTQDMGAQVLFIGAHGRLDGKILAENDLPYELIPARPFPYGLSVKTGFALWSLYLSRALCVQILRRFGPDAVFGAGGYVSAAGVLAAAKLGVPSICHASDAHPDRANRLLARWATRMTTNYEVAAEGFPAQKTSVVGQPVRRQFIRTTRPEAREALGIAPDAFVLLVVGGSQGARRLNHATLEALTELLADPRMHMIHSTGSLDYDDVVARAREAVGDEPRYRCVAFHEEPWLPLAAADLVLSRGGASSLAEIAVAGKPAIVVPYPHAAAHQTLNVRPLAEAGACIVVQDAELSGAALLEHVRTLRQNVSMLCGMSAAARQTSRPGAAGEIAGMLAELAGR